MSSHEDDRPVSVEFLGYRVGELHKRVRTIEEELDKYQLPVIALKLDQAVTALDDFRREVKRELAAGRKAVYALMFTIAASAVTFAFSMLLVLGHKP